MKTMFLAAVAALSLGLGSTFACEIERDGDLRDDNLSRGIQANTYFPQHPGAVAQGPVQTPAAAIEQNGQTVHSPGALGAG